MNLRESHDFRYFALVAASVAAPGALAQPPALSEQAYFEELPVVLSVSRLAQPIAEAPGAVTVIDREMIRQSGARHIIDLLRLVPGFQVAHGASMSPVAVYHGLGENFPRHMQVLVDGRSQYSPSFAGGVNWNLIPVSLDDIERIEVVRGSNSAAYGSNAFLGVVNIITRHASDTAGASAELHTGTQGVNDKRIRLGTSVENVSMRVTGETRRDEGLDNFRDRTERRLFDYRADWRVGLRDELQFQLGKISTTMQVGSGRVDNPLRDQEQSQQFVQLGWRRTLGESEDVVVRYYRAEEKATDAFTFNLYDVSPTSAAVLALLKIPNYPVRIDYGFTSVRNNLEAVHTFRPWQETRLVWGGEVRTDSVTGPIYYGRSDAVSLTLARLFGHLEWRFAPAWIANAGATWESDSNSKTTFAPRVALSWHAAPGQTLRVGVARAYRSPSLFEQRGEWTISSTTGVAFDRLYAMSGNLVPESVTSRELGWIGEFRPLRLTADVRAFEEKMADRMLVVPINMTAPRCEILSADFKSCGQANDALNAQDVRIRGIEHQVRWQPFDTTRIVVSQAFIRIVAQPHPLPAVGIVANYTPDKDLAQTVSSAPTHATTLMAMQKLPGGFELSATYSSVGAMKWSSNTYAQAWRRLDWRLGYPFRAGSTRGEVAFTVQNDGAPHAEHTASEILTRRSFVTLRLDY